ncbi:MAG: excinuclease ABC subunit UvrC [Gammaproteobacteria bacterium]|nr:excinuclease ABC subunit UvrC [Gammaproteobacteria bacterium]NIN61621.1 excinuclease ABC subunit UvrC [Gammaproteobacteria bacterium]NIO62815.1 excinuclease ABC subunit UvrC [Gammaproteobacteria bacterium]NIQ19379.1 excinuclease ABC subunit UvrC [Gammaproteobacteria bacterium]NIT05450.1 excinuclease ABC subunit UvrC [Gammaproteobacteria bacterium]
MINKDNFDPKSFARTLTSRPGVYRMLDKDHKVIYVGKARNLKKRVTSYFTRSSQHSPKTRVMVNAIASIEVTVTHTENEALILENNLIKELRPRYNIWFRDDKSYPYLYLSSDQEFPRLSYYRGARRGKGRYFGPYPSAGAARKTVHLIQKLFRLRSCTDSFFANRSRPCLQYQIKRCTAPCVDFISADEYQKDVRHAMMFLEGKNEEVIDALLEPMQEAAEQLDYERAAQYRDQISNLRKVQEHQYITAERGDIDIIACQLNSGTACVQMLFIRGGLNLGSKSFFPRTTIGTTEAELLEAFIPQFYLDQSVQRMIPDEILLSHIPEDKELLESVLSEKSGRKISLKHRLRGERARWLEMASENAAIILKQHLDGKLSQQTRLEELQELLKLDEPIERIECFDISHTQGEATVASCVVFGPQGPVSSDYRRFNIESITAGDDYAAMEQVLTRRYTRVKKEEGRLPDLILIDGGKGQISSAKKVMEELQTGDITLIGVAKGPSRKPGLETLIIARDNKTIRLEQSSPVLHLIQNIRDEAHRFAITGHRQRRNKKRNQSSLETIEGVGQKRRQNLIRHFGGLQGILRAGVEDLAKVPGINKNLARKIYDRFH